MIGRHITTLTTACIVVSVALLLLQQPFAYYSQDMSFHAARVLAAADGEYYSDPISGYGIAYPTLLHFLLGKVLSATGLSIFWLFRLTQLFVFMGLFVASWFFCQQLLMRYRISLLAALCTVFVLYAPTGKYFLLQNPSNVSIPFLLLGAGLFIRFTRGRRIRNGILGAVMIGLAIDFWWLNVVPAAGLGLGILYQSTRSKRVIKTNELLMIMGALSIVLAYNLLALPQFESSMVSQSDALTRITLAQQEGAAGTCLQWLGAFFLKGNQQFFDHLFPAVLSESGKAKLLYGFLAAVYFYLIVIPFNWALLLFSFSESFRKGVENEQYRCIAVASIVIVLLSIAAIVVSDLAKIRRLLYYVYLFQLPAFISYLNRTVFSKPRRQWVADAIAVVALLSIVYSSVYSPSPRLTESVSDSTRQVVGFIESVPVKPGDRIWMSDSDVRHLCRYVRFRSFLIVDGMYMHLRVAYGDSLSAAYNSIRKLNPDWHKWADVYGVKYAITSKAPVSREGTSGFSRDTSEIETYERFESRFPIVLENEEWAVFKLDSTED